MNQFFSQALKVAEISTHQTFFFPSFLTRISGTKGAISEWIQRERLDCQLLAWTLTQGKILLYQPEPYILFFINIAELAKRKMPPKVNEAGRCSNPVKALILQNSWYWSRIASHVGLDFHLPRTVFISHQETAWLVYFQGNPVFVFFLMLWSGLGIALTCMTVISAFPGKTTCWQKAPFQVLSSF